MSKYQEMIDSFTDTESLLKNIPLWLIALLRDALANQPGESARDLHDKMDAVFSHDMFHGVRDIDEIGARAAFKRLDPIFEDERVRGAKENTAASGAVEQDAVLAAPTAEDLAAQAGRVLRDAIDRGVDVEPVVLLRCLLDDHLGRIADVVEERPARSVADVLIASDQGETMDLVRVFLDVRASMALAEQAWRPGVNGWPQGRHTARHLRRGLQGSGVAQAAIVQQHDDEQTMRIIRSATAALDDAIIGMHNAFALLDSIGRADALNPPAVVRLLDARLDLEQVRAVQQLIHSFGWDRISIQNTVVHSGLVQGGMEHLTDDERAAANNAIFAAVNGNMGEAMQALVTNCSLHPDQARALIKEHRRMLDEEKIMDELAQLEAKVVHGSPTDAEREEYRALRLAHRIGPTREIDLSLRSLKHALDREAALNRDERAELMILRIDHKRALDILGRIVALVVGEDDDDGKRWHARAEQAEKVLQQASKLPISDQYFVIDKDSGNVELSFSTRVSALVSRELWEKVADALPGCISPDMAVYAAYAADPERTDSQDQAMRELGVALEARGHHMHKPIERTKNRQSQQANIRLPRAIIEHVGGWDPKAPETPDAPDDITLDLGPARPVVLTDPLHPTGRCTCAGAGSCEWCRGWQEDDIQACRNAECGVPLNESDIIDAHDESGAPVRLCRYCGGAQR